MFKYRSILAAGLVLGAVLVILRGRRWGLQPTGVLDGVLAAAGGGLLLGRAAYAGANWVYFRNHLTEALQAWRGGLSAPGMLIGAVSGVVILCRLRRVDPRPMLDGLAPGAALVALSAWLGCLVSGCAWGREVWPDQGLLWSLRAELPDLYGLQDPRVAVQGLGIGWNTVLLGILLLLGRRGRPFPLWLLLHAAGDFGLGFLRGDVTPLVGNMSSGQIADLALAFAGLALLITPGWRQEER